MDAGLALLSKNVLKLIEPGKAVSLEEDIYKVLIAEKQLAGYATAERFYDIGTPERLKKFEEVLDDYFPDTV